jgi:Helicase associated domain.
MFGELVQFKEVHGHCNVPQDYPENKSLGAWVTAQRTRRRKPNGLDPEQMNKLDSIGFVWNPHDELAIAWQQKLEELAQFKAIHGHCNVPAKYSVNKPLGAWVDTQRTRRRGRGKSLDPDQIDKLDAIGFVWGFKNNLKTLSDI